VRLSTCLIGMLLLTTLIPRTWSQERKHANLAPKLLTAKTVYFIDQTDVPPVAHKALEELHKWARFQIVQSPEHADLILLLSADPYRGGNVAVSGGQTGSVNSNGQIDVDRVPNFNKLSPVRHAYLTVIDPTTQESLWDDSHQWGGLLTGFNSVGERLIKQLENQMK
jgi:hypothetical protein